MFELQIFIPTESNAKVAFTEADHLDFENFVTTHFGGLTLNPGLARGVWVDGGVRYDDALRIYSIAVASIVDGAKVAVVVSFAKRKYHQEAIFVRYLGVTEIL